MTPDAATADADASTSDESTRDSTAEELTALRRELAALREENRRLRERVSDLEGRCADLEDRCTALEAERDALRDDLEDEREARREAETRLDALSDAVEDEHDARLDALEAKARTTRGMVAELQSRELEKGAHLVYEHVEPNVMDELLDVETEHVERITKENGQQYARLPGEEDALDRGGAVAQSTADLLPIQRLARYDDEMLANVTNRKPDELAAKAWRERDDTGRYGLWSKGSKGVRLSLRSSDLADWIMAREQGVSKNYAQELARRTMDAMRELSNHRLTEEKQTRRADGLTYTERRLVLGTDADIPGDRGRGDCGPDDLDSAGDDSAADAAPTTDEVAGG